ncbi:MAG: helix-turn-helix transcriptional regulator [Firmicutes bacterium]|nr:helix-turn-helix transcriptional regulator [Bacillota bacterium]
MSFSTKLKELRLQNNLSQEQLSRKLDITTRPYIDYEKGKKYPPVEVLVRMARFFEVSISYLMDEQDELPTNPNVHESIYGTHKADNLIKEISGLFMGEELSETNKDAVMAALQKAYRISKNK